MSFNPAQLIILAIFIINTVELADIYLLPCIHQKCHKFEIR